MGSNNILPWDDSLTNALSDAAYASSSLRTGGAPVGALLPSSLFNKVIAQTSMVCAALCQSLANKGFTISDSSYANLIAAMTNLRTPADYPASMAVVSYATSITFNAATSVGFQVTLTGNVTSSTLTSYASGQTLIFVLIQDSIGGRTFSWPSQITGGVSIGLTPNSVTVQSFIVTASGAIVPLVTPPSQPSQTVVTGSRSLGSVYQNSSLTTLWVSVLLTVPNNAVVTANSDSGVVPSTAVGNVSLSAGFSMGSTLVFPVLSGNYYSVSNVGAGTATVNAWVETRS